MPSPFQIAQKKKKPKQELEKKKEETPKVEPEKPKPEKIARADKPTGGVYQKDNLNFILPKKDIKGLADKNLFDPNLAQAQLQAEQDAQRQAEQEQLFSEPIGKPELGRDLTRGQETLSKLPVFGAGLVTVTKLITEGMRELEKKTGKKIIKNQELLDTYQPEVLKNEALTVIEKQVYEDGIDASIAFGAIIEGFPIVGGAIGKWGGGLVETPRSDIQAIRKDIKKEKTRITKYETWVRDGTLNAEVAEERAIQFEAQMQEYQSRLKLLTIYSSSLQYESDEINTIRTEIQTNLELLQGIRSRVIMYKGQQIDPTEWNVLFALDNLNAVED